jgi:hypothetical protein
MKRHPRGRIEKGGFDDGGEEGWGVWGSACALRIYVVLGLFWHGCCVQIKSVDCVIVYYDVGGS